MARPSLARTARDRTTHPQGTPPACRALAGGGHPGGALGAEPARSQVGSRKRVGSSRSQSLHSDPTRRYLRGLRGPRHGSVRHRRGTGARYLRVAMDPTDLHGAPVENQGGHCHGVGSNPGADLAGRLGLVGLRRRGLGHRLRPARLATHRRLHLVLGRPVRSKHLRLFRQPKQHEGRSPDARAVGKPLDGRHPNVFCGGCNPC